MNEIPEDIVPRAGLTLETLRRLNDTAGQPLTLTEPGEVLLDPDGLPIGVGPSTTSTVTMSGVFPRAQLDQLGGDPDDFPNLRFIDNTEGETL